MDSVGNFIKSLNQVPVKQSGDTIFETINEALKIII